MSNTIETRTALKLAVDAGKVKVVKPEDIQKRALELGANKNDINAALTTLPQDFFTYNPVGTFNGSDGTFNVVVRDLSIDDAKCFRQAKKAECGVPAGHEMVLLARMQMGEYTEILVSSEYYKELVEKIANGETVRMASPGVSGGVKKEKFDSSKNPQAIKDTLDEHYDVIQTTMFAAKAPEVGKIALDVLNDTSAVFGFKKGEKPVNIGKKLWDFLKVKSVVETIPGVQFSVIFETQMPKKIQEKFDLEKTLASIEQAKRDSEKLIKQLEDECGYTRMIEEANKKRAKNKEIQKAEEEVKASETKIADISEKLRNLK